MELNLTVQNSFFFHKTIQKMDKFVGSFFDEDSCDKHLEQLMNQWVEDLKQDIIYFS